MLAISHINISDIVLLVYIMILEKYNYSNDNIFFSILYLLGTIRVLAEMNKIQE